MSVIKIHGYLLGSAGVLFIFVSNKSLFDTCTITWKDQHFFYDNGLNYLFYIMCVYPNDKNKINSQETSIVFKNYGW